MEINIGFNPSCSEYIVSVEVPVSKKDEFVDGIKKLLGKRYKKSVLDDTIEGMINFAESENDLVSSKESDLRFHACQSDGDLYVALKAIADEMSLHYDEEWG